MASGTDGDGGAWLASEVKVGIGFVDFVLLVESIVSRLSVCSRAGNLKIKCNWLERNNRTIEQNKNMNIRGVVG